MALPPLPPQGQNPWYNDRTTWDNAVDAELQGVPLKALTTIGGAQGFVYPAGSDLGTITQSSLQTAADQAFAASTAQKSVRLVASGEITTDQTTIIRSDADLSNLKINYTGTGVAVQIGVETTLLQNVTVRCPKVVCSRNTVGSNWVNVPGTVGIRSVNVSQSIIDVMYVSQFETGLSVDGRNNQAHAYTTYNLGNLYNNKRNLVMDNDGLGWTTQNTFVGGRYAHASAEGINVTGVEQILVKPTSNPSRNSTSNNVFINPSVEGAAPQYHLSIAGRYNVIINPRLEVGGGENARVRYYDGARFNQIIGGYGSQAVTWTIEGDSANNSYYGIRTMHYTGGDPAPAFSVEKAAPSGAFINGYPAGWLANNRPLADYLWQITGRRIHGRMDGDAGSRAALDWELGRILLGSGAGQPTQGWGYVTGGIQALGPVAPASYTTANRPTASSLTPGSEIYDSTLGKKIMARGSAWVNLDGTAL